MKNQVTSAYNPQSGSIFVWIFVMIALFGALSFAMTKSLRSGQTDLSATQSDLMATEIIDYANKVATATKTLYINGCTDQTISFESPITVGQTATNATLPLYNNSSSPADKSCHVFYPAGGGLTYEPIQKKARNENFTPVANSWRDKNYFYFAGTVNFFSGTNSDIVMWGLHLRDEVCDSINKKLGIDGNVTVASGVPVNGNWPYNGPTRLAFWGVTYGDSSTLPMLASHKMGCIKTTFSPNSDGFPEGGSFYAIVSLRP